ncbi:hypothetical protein DV738_g1807, partial [Chaetothyriales sp. CBS 135597]
MRPQRYEAVAPHDADDDDDGSLAERRSTGHQQQHITIPASPPPSFRSRESSVTGRLLSGSSSRGGISSEADQDLADTFDDGRASDEEAEDEEDERQRFMRGNPNPPTSARGSRGPVRPPCRVERRVTELPAFHPPQPRMSSANDGVFANLAAKLDRGEQVEEKPPTYEQAAADATPPYWETTILAPGLTTDEAYVDGLPVGSLFSFIWNGMISMSFQLVGFLLTYLLHTTHAAKHGSRAGLGLTLVQYGFYMRSDPDRNEGNPGQFSNSAPPDPNSHSFDPSKVNAMSNSAGGAGDEAGGPGGIGGISSTDWVSYLLMIVGWFILIRAVSDFLRARKQEQLILSSPSRGLPVAVVAEGETPEQAA